MSLLALCAGALRRGRQHDLGPRRTRPHASTTTSTGSSPWRPTGCCPSSSASASTDRSRRPDDPRARSGASPSAASARGSSTATRTLVHYVEKFGNLGFGAELELGRAHRHRGGPAAAALPARALHEHRRAGAALDVRRARLRARARRLHGLRATTRFLITARTDTGKTTTALKTLDSLPFSFLSDDLTLLIARRAGAHVPEAADDQPAHAVRGEDAAADRRKERTELIVQSRLHSRSGRLFGLIIAQDRHARGDHERARAAGRAAAEVPGRPARAARRHRCRRRRSRAWRSSSATARRASCR